MQTYKIQLLEYLKDPLIARQTHFCTAEEWEFFSTLDLSVPSPMEMRMDLPRALPAFANPTAPKPMPAPKPESVAVEPPALKQSSSQSPTSTHDFADIKKMLQKIAPSINLHDAIPDDHAAQKISTAYKEALPEIEAVVLLCDEGQQNLDFVKTLAKAIDQHLAKAKVILANRLEQEKRWDLFLQKNTFRLIIATPGIRNCTGFMHAYHTVHAGKTPFLILSATPDYQNQELKAKLWKTLCQMLKK